MVNAEELSRIELASKIFAVKNRFFDFMVNYQYLENFLYCYLDKKEEKESLTKNSPFTNLVYRFIGIAKETNERCDGEVEKQLKELLLSFERNEFIHEFTNKYSKHLLGNVDGCPKEKIREAYEEIGNAKIKINKVATLLAAKGFKYKHISHAKSDRRFLLSERTLSQTKNNLIIDDLFDIKEIRKALIENYFFLFSIYNKINSNLLLIIKEMNKKTNMWSNEEINNLNNRAIGFLNAFLNNQNGKNAIIVNDILSNINDFSQLIKCTYIDRNYWIHYFAIDFYNTSEEDITECASVKHKKQLLFVLESTKQSVVFANNFNNQLVRLRIHKD